MGGGPEDAKERILIILPWPEPKEYVEKLRARNPQHEVSYIFYPHFGPAAQSQRPKLPEGN